MSASALAATRALRDASHFQWYLVPLFAFVVYFYCSEAAERRWNIIVAGLAYWSIEWIGEVINALILHFSGYAPLWGEPGPTSYLIMVGINAETALMFTVFGLAVGKILQVVENRWLVIAGFSLLAVSVESLLHAWGALTWDWRFWGWPHLWSVVLFAYAPAVAFTIWVHDLKSLRLQFTIIGAVVTLDLACFLVFMGALGWI
jgi:hypothetical protein